MKIKSILVCIIFASTGLNAATCLSTAEQKTVNRNHKNSLESYDYVRVDCTNLKLKAICSDSMNVKMLNTMIRMNVWDEENVSRALHRFRDKLESWGMAQTLRDLGIKENELPQIVNNIMSSPRIGMVSKLSAVEVESLLMLAY